MKFSKKISKIGGLENHSLFELAILIFFQKKIFLLHPNENQSTFIGQQG